MRDYKVQMKNGKKIIIGNKNYNIFELH